MGLEGKLAKAIGNNQQIIDGVKDAYEYFNAEIETRDEEITELKDRIAQLEGKVWKLENGIT